MAEHACVLIAGAGDVGMRLAHLRAGLGDEVVTMRRRDGERSQGIRPVRADLLTGGGFAQLPQRPDALVFCATPDERSEAAYRALFVDGLRRLLDRIEPLRVLFTSSTAVYAQDAGEWVDEISPALADSFNGRALRAAEQECWVHPRGQALRLSGLYGPGRDAFATHAREATAAGRRRWSNRIHLDDAASALSHLLGHAPDEALYIGSDNQPTLEYEMADWLRQREGLPALGAPEEPVPSGRRVSSARLQALGWSPAHPDYRSGYPRAGTARTVSSSP